MAHEEEIENLNKIFKRSDFFLSLSTRKFKATKDSLWGEFYQTENFKLVSSKNK